jgi:hypothetical protein
MGLLNIVRDTSPESSKITKFDQIKAVRYSEHPTDITQITSHRDRTKLSTAPSLKQTLLDLKKQEFAVEGVSPELMA